MPRPRKFDEGEVLDAAIGRFWQQGYLGTTIRDLTADMRMTSASLYNAFGDKRSMFIRALQRYVTDHPLAALARISKADDPMRALEAFLHGLVTEAMATGQGCLLISAAAEVPATDHELRNEISLHLTSIEDALYASLKAARRKALIPQTLNCSEQARIVLSAIISIQILARTGAHRKVLETIARSAIPPSVKIAA